MTVTPDARFARYVLRPVRQFRRLLAILGSLLVATGVGSVVGESPLLLLGLMGVPCGVMCVVAAIRLRPRRLIRSNPRLLAPVRYVVGPDGVEWHTDVDSYRLSWAAVRQLRRAREAYVLVLAGRDVKRHVCRTTLTPEQDAELATRLEEAFIRTRVVSCAGVGAADG